MAGTTFVLEANEDTPPAPALLTGQLTAITTTGTGNVVTLQIRNTGAGDANDVRLDGFTFPAVTSTTPAFPDRDPDRMPLPVIDRLAAGGSATVSVPLDFTAVPSSGFNAVVPFSANGGRVRGSLTASVAPAIAGNVQLLTTSTVARQTDGSYLATLTFTNQGSGTAQNVQLTAGSLGTANGSALPAVLGNLAPAPPPR